MKKESRPSEPLKQPPTDLWWKAVFRHLGPELAKLPPPPKTDDEKH